MFFLQFARHILAIPLFLLIGQIQLQAQNIELIQLEVSKIRRFYDSSVYLSFNTSYTYDTDTVHYRSKHSSLDGEFTMYGNKYFYRVGAIEYMRNDSFSIVAYNDDKFLVASRTNGIKGASSVLPMADISDSLLYNFYGRYSSSIGSMSINGDTLKQIQFIKNRGDTIAAYDYFYMNYDPDSYYLHSIEYGLRQPVEMDADSSYDSNWEPWNVRFNISFSNYAVKAIEPRYFSEARFINEQSPGKWIASGKYNGYTVYWSDERLPQTISLP